MIHDNTPIEPHSELILAIVNLVSKSIVVVMAVGTYWIVIQLVRFLHDISECSTVGWFPF